MNLILACDRAAPLPQFGSAKLNYSIKLVDEVVVFLRLLLMMYLADTFEEKCFVYVAKRKSFFRFALDISVA